MTQLDDIIQASTDSSTSTPDLLRKVQIVARRVHAEGIEAWVKKELNGYGETDDLPEYRVKHSNVMGVYSGPMRSTITYPLTVRPSDLDPMWILQMREPVAEVDALAQGDGDDPSREWGAIQVEQYEASGVFRMEYHSLFRVYNVVSRHSLKGVVDAVRSKAMELALDLQADFPEAGSLNGPTVASNEELERTVFNITNNIYGDGTNVGAGTNFTQWSNVTKGDLDSLRRALANLGLEDASAEELISEVEKEGSTAGEKTQGILERIRNGSLTLAGNVAGEAAAAGVLGAIQAFLG